MAEREQSVRRPPSGRKRRTKSTISSATVKSESGNADLKRKLAKAQRELTEARRQQTATADVLKVISRSTFDLQAVLHALTETAARLCNADMASITRQGEAGHFYHVTGHNFPPDWVEYTRQVPLRPERGTVVGRTLLTKKAVQVADVLADPEYTHGEQQRKAGYRTFLGVPLLREGEPIGVFSLCRTTVAPFSEKQISLLSSFADQAVIAIENVRLFDEVTARTRDLQLRTEDLGESLQQQTATADVLKVISRSAFDLQAVFETLVESSVRLCGADRAFIFRFDGELLRMAAGFNCSPEFTEWVRQNPIRPGRHSGSARAALERRTIHIPDVLSDPGYTYGAKDVEAIRTVLGVPILKGDDLLGVIMIYHLEIRPFTDKQIALVETFADQAAIAIENVRLFDEVQARTADLQESLEYQTATSDVLEVISRSTSDLQPVLDTMLKAALRLCRLRSGAVAIRQGEVLRYVATIGLAPEFDSILRSRDVVSGDNSLAGQTVQQRRVVQIEDLAGNPDYRFPEAVTLNRTRTAMGVPLLREGEIFGVIALTRDYVEPFSERQVSLARTFADQAVIAMENARLLGELTRREHELRATFDHMGDGVVMFDADLKLASWNRNFQELLDISDSFLAGRPELGDYVRLLVGRGEVGDGDAASALVTYRERVDEVWSTERIRPDGRVIEVRNNPVPGGGAVLIYSDITHRKKAEEEIRAARDAAEAALEELRTAQDRLIQTEKRASLGQLTAGIAHEIKNPLNFVNNFSALSVELVDELGEVLKPAPLDKRMRQETDELGRMLKGNLEKVVQHGKRADLIVKNMLLHSRESSSERRLVNLNGLVEECLNLAYHTARAENQEFKMNMERSFDPTIGRIDLFPQEMTRVLLNLISNGFYAATKRKAETKLNGHEPTLAAATKNLGDRVEIRIRDNGGGIPTEVMDKIFNPFFTTKPPGEGTGLGLSLSHDIVVKQHAGSIEVDTRHGEFTEFKVVLPRMAATGKAGADK
jgi:two-component system, NtrC family, sensor kinase